MDIYNKLSKEDIQIIKDTQNKFKNKICKYSSSFESMYHDWEECVGFLSVGYDLKIGEYSNYLCKRDLMEIIILLLSHEGQQMIRDRMQPLDDKFIEYTLEATLSFIIMSELMPLKYWWYHLPLNLYDKHMKWINYLSKKYKVEINQRFDTNNMHKFQKSAELENSQLARVIINISNEDKQVIINIQNKLMLHGYHNSLIDFLKSWELFIENISKGYCLTDNCYSNSLDEKDLMEIIILSLSDDGQQIIREILQPFDDKFNLYTFEINTPLFNRNTLMPLKHWWYRLPLNPSDSFIETIKPYKTQIPEYNI